jgi:hypothetical protein
MRICSSLLVGLIGLLTASAQDTLQVSPHRIELGTLYDGATVEIKGEAGPGSDIAIIIRGPETEETFNKKVQAGPIWISSGKVHITGAPILFLSYRTAPVRSVLDDDVVDRNHIDLEAIRDHMEVDAEGDPVDARAMRENYIELKREVDIYAVYDSGIEFDKATGGTFSLTLDWPRRAPPEEYSVTAYEIRDGSIVNRSESTIELVKVGLPADLARFSTEKAAQYGALSVLIAACAGFGINFLVSRLVGGRRHVGH